MKILFVTPSYHYPQLLSGTETSTHESCLQLARRGLAPAVMAALHPRGWLPLSLRLRRHVLRDEYPSDRRPGYDVFRVWEPLAALAGVVPRVGPDAIVIIKNHRGMIEAALATGRPCFLYLHSVNFIDPRPYPALRCIANSHFTADALRQQFGVSSVVIPPWINAARYRTVSRREVALFVNPHRSKGVETVFELARLRPDIPFLIVESWPLSAEQKADFRARAAALPNIIWQTAVLDMRKIYARAKVLLVPSRDEESWGRVATEAQASGIPVIASDRGGLPEAVGPGGVIVDVQGPQAMARWHEALSRVWDEPQVYQSLSAAARAHSQREAIDPEKMLDAFLACVGRAGCGA